jgi:hypothetical protein
MRIRTSLALRTFWSVVFACSALFFFALLACSPAFAEEDATPAAQITAVPQWKVVEHPKALSKLSSPYINDDSWMVPAIVRLYSLGYIDTAFLGMRPWTRLSVVHMLEQSAPKLEESGSTAAQDEARGIYDVLWRELRTDAEGGRTNSHGRIQTESLYTVMRGISGTPLRDSFHLGQTIVNDYGRPYSGGFNNYTGVSGYGTSGRFSLYFRGETQYAPSATGYSLAFAQRLSAIDSIPYNTNPNQATIPLGPIGATGDFRLMEGYISYHLLGHEFSLGKSDEWMGPAAGSSMAYSNNAENIYSFRINRVEPMHIPFVSRYLGPLRYDFLVGSLKGHTAPNHPWIHTEKFAFRPTKNFEFGFERTVIWGGKGHEPVNLHTFLRSFFDFNDTSASVKNSAQDPGARFSAFDVSYRLPWLRDWVTFYTDSECHDDASPPSAPRRAAFRTGLDFSHLPRLPKLELRGEAILTDPSTSVSTGGVFMYREVIQLQGYTNKGQLFGDWMGREAKGGQVWATWHLSGNEFAQISWRGQKVAKDFINGGTTLNDFTATLVKRIGKHFEANIYYSREDYLIPLYNSYMNTKGRQGVNTTNFQFTWYPQRRASF